MINSVKTRISDLKDKLKNYRKISKDYFLRINSTYYNELITELDTYAKKKKT